MKGFFFIWTVLLGSACSDREQTDLVKPDAWQILPPDEDPYESLRPDGVTCNPLGITVEEGVLEVQTDVCGFVTLWQPALANTRDRDLVSLLAYHSALFSDPPDEGEMAILFGEEVIWSVVVDIPGEADVYQEDLETYPMIKAGDPILFHVHNHGANSWKLAYLRTEPP